VQVAKLTQYLVILLSLGLSACSTRAPLPIIAQLDPVLWQEYRAAFVSRDGRVIDIGNGRVSHTEGQGYGMLLAVSADDRATFDLMWAWTRKHLSRPNDPLFSFRWHEATTPAVPDPNNASDGDILIAWALARAAQRWQAKEYEKEAAVISNAFRNQLLRSNEVGTLILPGMVGFEHQDYVIVNLSYWIFPAFQALNHIDPSPQWLELEKSGTWLLKHARFGDAGLPPDWVNITTKGKLELGREESSRFSFDAVRIPLYSCWGGIKDETLLKAVEAEWSDPQLPAWVNLKTGERAPYALSPTQKVMNRIVSNCMESKKTASVEPIPYIFKDDYYASTLALLGELAMKEIKP